MSLAEQFRQEGIRKGRQEGLVYSKQQDILEALEIRFNRVPEGLREEIELIADTAKLQSLLRAMTLTASTPMKFGSCESDGPPGAHRDAATSLARQGATPSKKCFCYP
jgi:hypothetical protein